MAVKLYNEIEIVYSRDEMGRFCADDLSIKIEKLSSGSLALLLLDLEKLCREWKEKENEIGHPVVYAYQNLLQKLTDELKKQIHPELVKHMAVKFK